MDISFRLALKSGWLKVAKQTSFNNMNYSIYIKSHTEAPDYENEIEADNIIEALEKLCKESPFFLEWDFADLIENIGCDVPRNKKPFADKVIDELMAKIRKETRTRNEEGWEKEKKEELLLKLQKFIAQQGLLEDFLKFNREEE